VLSATLLAAEEFLHARKWKFFNIDPRTFSGSTLEQVPAASNARRSVSLVNDLIGVENLIPRPWPENRGRQQTTIVGSANHRPDFTVHRNSAQRKVNLLFCRKEHRGPESRLDLESSNADTAPCVGKNTPGSNSDQSPGKRRYFQRPRGGR
jgi:hypothetical protein